MKNFDFKKLIPHLIVIAIFFVITMIYFSPMIGGKVLKQMDVTHVNGGSKELTDFHKNTNEYSQWTNSMFGGMPAYNVGPYHTVKDIYYWFTRFFKFGLPLYTLGIVFSYLIAFYFLMIALKIKPWLALLGSIAFAFSSYNFIIIPVGHVSKAYAIAYMAPVIAGIMLAYRKKLLLGSLITMIGLGVEIASNHLQMTYYLFLTVLVIIIVEFIFAIRNKEIKYFAKASTFLAVAAILAAIPNSELLYTSYEMGNESTRGKTELTINNKENKASSGLDKDYAFQWSYGKAETFTFLVPNFMGGGGSTKLDESSNTFKAMEKQGIGNKENLPYFSQFCYWGDQPFTSGPVYLGAIICFFFILGLFIVKGPEKWWLLIATILSILLSWGKNFEAFNDFFFYYFPFYSKFRSVSSILVIAGLTVPLMAILAIRNLMDETNDKAKFLKSLKISFYIVGGLLLLFILIPGLFFDFAAKNDEQLMESLTAQNMPNAGLLMNGLISDRESLLRMDALRSFVFIGLAFGLAFAYLKNKLKINVLLGVLIGLVLIDMWAVDKRYFNNDDFTSKRETKDEFQASVANTEILKDVDPNYRVVNLNGTFQEVTTSYFHKSIGGYHGAKLRKYNELIEYRLSKEVAAIIKALQNKPTDSSITAVLSSVNGLNMLNSRYVIYNPDVAPLINKFACGNAWFVNNYNVVENADAEIQSLDKINPRYTAVIQKKYAESINNFKTSPDSNAFIHLKADGYKPNKLTYESSSNSPQLAVFSEIYYDKSWNAYLDGNKAPYFRTNYVLRGMIIPAGKHEIVFKCEPANFQKAESVTLWTSILVGLIILAYFVMQFIKKPEEKLAK